MNKTLPDSIMFCKGLAMCLEDLAYPAETNMQVIKRLINYLAPDLSAEHHT